MKQSADASALIVSDAEEQARLIRLQRSGLFDGAWFAARNPDLAAESHSALIHWHRQGWQENRLPNAYFDTGYYRERNPDCTGDPLLHGPVPAPHGAQVNDPAGTSPKDPTITIE